MDTEILQGIGLTEPQVKAYLALLNAGTYTPAALAEEIGETRTNTYAVLAKLESARLVTRDTSGKTLRYKAAHPVNLEAYVERRRNMILNWEYKFKSIMPGMVKTYFATTEQPEVRFFQGKEALEHIYEDILDTKKDLHLIMTPNQHDYMGDKFLRDFVKERVKKKIHVEALTPNTPGANHSKAIDKKMLLHRTFYDPAAFDMPVEINIYGDKVAYLSFGDEVMGTIIHSPQIAQAMRELFRMLQISSNIPQIKNP